MNWTGIGRVARALGRGVVGNPEPTVVALTEDYGHLAGRVPAPQRTAGFNITVNPAEFGSIVVSPGVDREIRFSGADFFVAGSGTLRAIQLCVLPSISGTADTAVAELHLHGDPEILESGENATPGRLGSVRQGNAFDDPQETIVRAYSGQNLQAPTPTDHGLFVPTVALVGTASRVFNAYPVMPYPAYYFAVSAPNKLLFQNTASGVGFGGVLSFYEVPKAGL